MFYYRRVRKLNFIEVLGAMAIIIVIGHYFVLWAQYFEQKLCLVYLFFLKSYLNTTKLICSLKDERLTETRRKLEKKQRKGNKKMDMDEIDKNLNQIYDLLVYPSLKNTLPIRFILWIYTNKLFVPFLIGLFKNRNKKKLEDDDEQIAAQIEEENRKKSEEAEVKRRKLVNDLNPKKIEKSNIAAPVVVTNDKTNDEDDSDKNNNETEINPNVWTDNDKAALIKAIKNYPGGTSDRWVKISAFVGKSAKQCTDMEKKLRSNFNASSVLNKTVGTNLQDNQFVSDDIMTKRDDSDDEEGNSVWSQEQQKLLENALKTVDKNSADKWEKISAMIPGKTKVYIYITVLRFYSKINFSIIGRMHSTF